MKKMTAVVIVIGAAAFAASPGAQTNPQLGAVQRAVSIAEIQKTLDALNIDRTSGKEGERQADEQRSHDERDREEQDVVQVLGPGRIRVQIPVRGEPGPVRRLHRRAPVAQRHLDVPADEAEDEDENEDDGGGDQE